MAPTEGPQSDPGTLAPDGFISDLGTGKGTPEGMLLLAFQNNIQYHLCFDLFNLFFQDITL